MTLPKRGTKEWRELKNRLYDYGPEIYEFISRCARTQRDKEQVQADACDLLARIAVKS